MVIGCETWMTRSKHLLCASSTASGTISSEFYENLIPLLQKDFKRIFVLLVQMSLSREAELAQR
jgi:hypothetical protein